MPVDPSRTREFNFDGLVGPTHFYAGLSAGNLASVRHAGRAGNPRAAALQGLAKMRLVAGLGVGQALLPPQPRPDLGALRRLGFHGSDAEVLKRAAQEPELLKACSSASAMWTANAATVAPGADTLDGRTHVVVANLSSMFHRSLEAETTEGLLRAVFADPDYFEVHRALPATQHFGDEGAANHTRLWSRRGVAHLFGFGRHAGLCAASLPDQSSWPTPSVHPARQTREASEAVIRLLRLEPERALLWQQTALGIDAGAFHSDVLLVGNAQTLLVHERAFYDLDALLEQLRTRLGDEFHACVAAEAELPIADAVANYPFNSQLVSVPQGGMVLIAPMESRHNPRASGYLERVVSESRSIHAIHYVDVNASMNNGGGPACLRLRVPLTERELDSIKARVFWSEALDRDLQSWVERHYRDRLSLDDLTDPSLLTEVHTALDELTTLLGLGAVYDFQH